MKGTLLVITLIAGSLTAFGQGKVAFGNDSNHYIVFDEALASADSALGGGVSSTNGNTPSGTVGAIPVSPLPSGLSLVAALYAGQTANALALQASFVLTGANWLSPGRMATKAVTLTFPGGTPAFFDIFVLDNNTILQTNTLPSDATTYAYLGTSGLFTATPGTSIEFPGLVSGTAASSTWAPANLVIGIPEPASFSLLGLGAAATMILRRHRRRVRD